MARFPSLRSGRRGVGDPYQSFRNEMERLAEDFFGDRGDLWPSVDVEETETEYRIVAELPGVAEDHIDVSIADNVLTIHGEKRSQSEGKEQEGRVMRTERSFGSFERSFTLPSDADADRIDAESAQGLLTIRIPKKPERETGGRRVEIRRG